MPARQGLSSLPARNNCTQKLAPQGCNTSDARTGTYGRQCSTCHSTAAKQSCHHLQLPTGPSTLPACVAHMRASPPLPPHSMASCTKNRHVVLLLLSQQHSILRKVQQHHKQAASSINKLCALMQTACTQARSGPLEAAHHDFVKSQACDQSDWQHPAMLHDTTQ